MWLWPNQKKKLLQIARRAVKDGYKIVIAMGGDGTIEAVMRGMIGSKVSSGYYPVQGQKTISPKAWASPKIWKKPVL